MNTYMTTYIINNKKRTSHRQTIAHLHFSTKAATTTLDDKLSFAPMLVQASCVHHAIEHKYK